MNSKKKIKEFVLLEKSTPRKDVIEKNNSSLRPGKRRNYEHKEECVVRNGIEVSRIT